MLYITNEKLPERFRNDNGLNLCKLWFYALQHDIDRKALKKFDPDLVEIEEVSAYKIIQDGNEILLIGDSYFVGDGFGNPIYLPCKYNEDYEEYLAGNLRISKKFEVKYVGE